MTLKYEILSADSGVLRKAVEEWGLKPFVADQIFDWIYQRGEVQIQDMKNIAKASQQVLVDHAQILPFQASTPVTAPGDVAVKFCHELFDQVQIESVALKERDGYTLCISTQAGCALGCQFCATGAMGFVRNLTTAEIVGQVVSAHNLGFRANRIVMMGMGEPLLNLDAVIMTLRILADRKGYLFGKRRITLSTVGIVAGLRKLIEKKIEVNLAVSIGHTDPKIRMQLIPAERINPLIEVVELLKRYYEMYPRTLTLAYTVIKGQNDDRASILDLIKLARYLRAKVNLICLNTVPDSRFVAVSDAKMRDIKTQIELENVPVTIRFKKGQEIAAGCGQLASQR